MSVIFDADAIAATLEPPVFTHRGRQRVGRFLSVEEWYGLMVQHRALLDSAAPATAWTIHLRLFFDAVFPRAWWERLGLRVFGRWWPRVFPSVADVVGAWPYQEQLRVYNRFLGSLAEVMWPVRMTASEPGPTGAETKEPTTDGETRTAPATVDALPSPT